MEIQLYPLQFDPIFKERLWGGSKLKTVLDKSISSLKTGESWEISTIEGNVSTIANGVMKGKLLTEAIQEFPLEILGTIVYERFGNQFPLLFKYLDAKEDLSVQVHPNDLLAKKRHNSFGKTEMWYLVQADSDARLIVGFKEEMSQSSYIQNLVNKTLLATLDEIKVQQGDVFLIETGTIHAIGAGTVIAEIQQTSDITYRLYDFDRVDSDGNLRELHVDLALDAIKNPKIIEDKDKVQRYLQMIKEENKRMHAQVENVLRISKLERNELDISKEPRDVTEIIEDAIEHVSLIVEDREGVIHSHFNAQRSTILLNEVHFTNVLVNMLDNAIKYSPNAPVIDVFTENIKDFILIKIQDQGAGMSKVAQKRVFEKFYREHTGDLHNVKGHGLGLAYVKQIVEDHNGQIFVESEKGKGSTFIIKMPLIN